ncbi:MAG: NAD(P)-dependent alcohol dehydrogenase [Chloroflexi bacterium]|nr:NAD(P)-dependent alcohol dehydrogenase [Chloroflexota bacterium]
MKAIVHYKYGSPDVLELRDIDKPVPADDEVLVRVHASSVNPVEWYGMTGLLLARPSAGWLKPKDPRLGTDYAGVVEEVGENVKDFQPGDEVYGGRHGAYADYVCVRDAVAPKPKSITFEQAAAIPIAGLTALQGLRDHGKIQPGQKVLINGASGGVGTFAVQVAKALGAEVTAVCSSQNVEKARSLGADHVVDYPKEDFTRSEHRYDLLFDIAGSRSWREYKRVLAPNATFVLVGGPKTPLIGPVGHIIRIKLVSLRASQKVVFFIANFNRADFAVMNELIAAGKVTPVIDRQYKLKDLPEAMRYFGEGHARGKIAITMNA